MKFQKRIHIGIAILIMAVPYSAFGSESDTSLVLQKCQPLIDAANNVLVQRKKKAAVEATAISGGGTLSEAACLDSLMGIDFDYFMNVSSLSGMVSGLFDNVKEQFQGSLKEMACDFSDELKAQSDTFLTCTANLSVDLSLAGGLPTPDLQSCLNTGMNGYSFDYSGSESYGTGSSSISKRFSNSQTLTGSGTEASQSSTDLLNKISEKVQGLNSLQGGQ
ncbi:hypothetical protein [uncultured Amphritea sp.]|uniref:hypothetical protein n=1 Tax=uncultured Amphritea sp. TaxID=981605 RepID=UPI00260C5301|nr:hypothetical protein [uncultured Amphritea sp.]